MTKILITGCNGQLGNEIRDIADKTPFSFTYTDVAELDITDINAIDSLFAATPFDYVVNCAAYTNVNKAESEEDIAYKINAVAPENLAKVCAKYNSTLIHVSTDYVFDGNACQPYSESDSVCPQSAYGRTKLAGDNLALKACQNTIILRTAWLYSEYGNGTPTYAGDLAQTILSIIKKIENGDKETVPGIYHFSNEGVCSWYDFTKEIHSLANITCNVRPIESKDFPSPAKRPFYSVLNKQKIKETYSIDVPYWKDSLALCIKNLQKQ